MARRPPLAGVGLDDEYVGRSGFAQHLGAFVDRGPGGKDIVHQQEALPVQFIRVNHGKGSTQILEPRRPRQFGLRLSVAKTDQVAVRERNTKPATQPVRQQE